MNERERFEFVRQRDGLDAALEFEQQTVRVYRENVLNPLKYARHYKRGMATLYCQAKRILREEGAL